MMALFQSIIEKMKIVVPFRYVPTSHVIENSKKTDEKLKKTPLWHHFKPKQVGKG